MKKDTPRGSTLINAIQSDSVAIGKEYLEVGVDALLESGALKDIPIVNTIVGMFNIAGSVRDQLLTSKLIRFIIQLSEIPQKERIEMVEKLNNNGRFAGKAGAAVIEILERMESERKPELVAKCFIAYARNEISFEELRRILFALERLPSFDIEKLKQFSQATIEESIKMDEAILLSFSNAGLGRNNGGYDGGAILPTNLCKKFVEIGLCS